MVVLTYNPSTRDMKTGSELQGHSPLHRKFYATLESMRLSQSQMNDLISNNKTQVLFS